MIKLSKMGLNLSGFDLVAVDSKYTLHLHLENIKLSDYFTYVKRYVEPGPSTMISQEALELGFRDIPQKQYMTSFATR